MLKTTQYLTDNTYVLTKERYLCCLRQIAIIFIQYVSHI